MSDQSIGYAISVILILIIFTFTYFMVSIFTPRFPMVVTLKEDQELTAYVDEENPLVIHFDIEAKGEKVILKTKEENKL